MYDFSKGDAGLVQRFLGGAGHGERQVEDADDGRPLRAAVVGVVPADHVGGHAALPIGRTGQRDQGRQAAHEIANLDGVADGENVRVAGPHPLIHADAARWGRSPARPPGRAGCRA